MRDTQGKKRNHAEALRKQGIEVVELDVNSDASVDHGVHEVLKRAKRIDVLVNNAGVTFPFFGTYGASKFAPNPMTSPRQSQSPWRSPRGSRPARLKLMVA
jgi:NAD(P)-dependent dehydrogenase (short-subunit alcohol dehydrogenase family)